MYMSRYMPILHHTLTLGSETMATDEQLVDSTSSIWTTLLSKPTCSFLPWPPCWCSGRLDEEEILCNCQPRVNGLWQLEGSSSSLWPQWYRYGGMDPGSDGWGGGRKGGHQEGNEDLHQWHHRWQEQQTSHLLGHSKIQKNSQQCGIMSSG